MGASVQTWVLLPLLAALLAMPAAFAPVRRAFARPAPPRLLPGESVRACLRPDLRLLAGVALALCTGLLAVPALLGGPVAALMAAPLAVAGLAWLGLDSRHAVLVTDRRLICASGAALPLAGLARLRIGPALLIAEGRGGWRIVLVGVARPQAAARTIRDAALCLRL